MPRYKLDKRWLVLCKTCNHGRAAHPFSMTREEQMLKGKTLGSSGVAPNSPCSFHHCGCKQFVHPG